MRQKGTHQQYSLEEEEDSWLGPLLCVRSSIRKFHGPKEEESKIVFVIV